LIVSMPATKAKRKATVDMNDSPPKRVTRARGKATDDEGLKPTAAKVVTASAKIAAARKKAVAPARGGARMAKANETKDVEAEPATAEQPREHPSNTKARQKKAPVPARPTKRKARADYEAEAIDEPVIEDQPIVEEQPKPEPFKTTSRQRKAVTTTTKETMVVDAPKPRARQPKAAEVEEVPRTRGRPKRIAEAAPAPVEEPTEELVPVKKTTRGRAATVTSKLLTTSAPKSAPRSTTAATKKRVKFQEATDKENIPIESAIPKKSAMKPTGMKAKPVRKPAQTRGSTRGKKGTQETLQDTQEANKGEIMPLSPKKDKQVAKSDPASSEDELCSAKTPIKALSKSPAKRPMSPIKDFGSVSKLNFNHSTAPSSPDKTMSASILASPARRPPASPFKDALKSSPKKVSLGDSIAQPVLLSSRTPMKAFLLQQSPKRKNLGDSTLKTIVAASKSPFKASLLQSPARRPTSSPKKSVMFGSPDKSARSAIIFEATSPIKQESSCKIFSSPAKPPQQDNFKVFEKEGLTTISADDDAETLQLGKSEPQSALAESAELTEFAPDEPAEFEDSMDLDHAEDQEEAAIEIATSPEPPAMFAAPAFNIASAAFRRVSIESESEDELASPQKAFGVTPLRRLGVSTKDFGTPAVIEGQMQPSNADISFTPIVDQLSSWAASSPDKKSVANPSRQARGVFSLGGAKTPAGPELIDHVLGDELANPSFFDDEMAMHDDLEDSVLIRPAPETVAEGEQNSAAFQVSQDSLTSEDYGDENTMPDELEMLRAEQEGPDPTLTCTPARVFTPARVVPREHREFHTVSKVPLRAAAEDSPLKVPRQRSRSFGGPLAAIQRSKVLSGAETPSTVGEQPATPVLSATAVPQTPSSAVKLDAETPTRTVRKGIVPDVLKGAVVYVDVHTTEGADASGIFVDLLTQMGARCVKQWNWNPRASMGSSPTENVSLQGMSPDTSKVGITHVVYKDGGKRTLEKVRSSNGVVFCVGVGWVLE
jgi:hypothetical protein